MTYSRPESPIDVEDIHLGPVWSRLGMKDLVRHCCSRVADRIRDVRLFVRAPQDLIAVVSVCSTEG